MEKKKCYSFIGCGELSSLYYYILYSIASKCFADFVLVIPGKNSNMFNFNPVLNGFTLIKSFYKYISFIIFGTIVYYYSLKKNKTQEMKLPQKIDNEIKKEYIYRSNSFTSVTNKSEFIRVILLYVFYLELIKISYFVGFHDFDLWMFNIVFTSFFISLLYNQRIYIHQLISLGFNFIINFIIAIISGIREKIYIKAENVLGNEYYSFFIIFLYILNSFSISYTRVLGKTIMELRYISPYKIIFFIGIVGFLFISILLIFSSIFNNYYEINTICTGKEPLFNKNCTYFDSFPMYFSSLKETNYSKEFWIECLIVTPLNLVANYLEFNFEILLIYYLNPIYILVSDSIYYGIIALITYIIQDDKENPYNILKVTSDILAFISYLVYLEIIELRFCRLNENIRKEITNRANLETNINLIDIEPIIHDGDDDDDEDSQNYITNISGGYDD